MWVSLTNVRDGKALTEKAVRRYSMIPFYGKKKDNFHISRERKEKREKEKTTSTLCTLACQGIIFLLSKVAAAVFAQRQRQS